MEQSTRTRPASKRIAAPTLTPDEAALIQRAAGREDRSVSKFIARAAIAAAKRTLNNVEKED